MVVFEVVVVAFVVVVVSVVVVVLVVVVAYFLRRCLPGTVVSLAWIENRSHDMTYQPPSNSSNGVSEPLGRTSKSAANVATAKSTGCVAQRLAQSTCGSPNSLANAACRAVDGLASDRQALADIANSHDALLANVADSVQGALSGLANGTQRAALALPLTLALLSLESLLLLLEGLLLLALGEDLVRGDLRVLRVDLLLLRRCLGLHLRHGLLDRSLWLLGQFLHRGLWGLDRGLGHLADEGLLVREAGDLFPARQGGGHVVLGRMPDLLLLFLLLRRGFRRPDILGGGILDCLLRFGGSLAY